LTRISAGRLSAEHRGIKVIRGFKIMKTDIKQYPASQRRGSILVLVAVLLIIFTLLGIGMLGIASGVRHHAIQLKNEAAAMLAAEAGYEKAVFWMGQQMDMLSALQQNVSGTSGTISFPNSSCNYQIGLFAFVRKRPIYRVISNGHSGVFSRTVDAYVVQAISGWDMGKCRVPLDGTTTYPVHFADGEIIDVPIHINKLPTSIDPTDLRDIYILGSPRFLQPVAMGESKYRSGGGDKPGYNDSRDYDNLMDLFEDGICFNQPDCRITDEDAVQMKVDRFRTSTDDDYNFSDDTSQKPNGDAPVPNHYDAVQLEFFVEAGTGIGKVRITNNCTVRGYQRNTTWDWKIKPGSEGDEYERYDIYAYHVRLQTEPIIVRDINDTYVSQVFGEVESEPGGQIFVDGSVVIGGHNALGSGDQVVKGTVTVVATGNIWIADSIKVSDYDDAGVHYPRSGDGMPAEDNPNILGLIAQGVVKVIDPGMSRYESDYSEYNEDYPYNGGNNDYPGPVPPEYISGLSGYVYAPVAHPESTDPDEIHLRYLSDQTVVEAAMVIGGGGWGAENVARKPDYYSPYYGGRLQATSGNQDYLIVRGTIVECCRGVVGLIGQDGYLKHYYFDERVLSGILPGDIWLQGKYVPAPAGWHDYR